MEAKTQKSKTVHITGNRLVLIHAIYSFPDHTAPSQRQVVERAVALCKARGAVFSDNNLHKSLARRLAPYVIKTRHGNKAECALTQLSLDIIEGRTPYQVHDRDGIVTTFIW